MVVAAARGSGLAIRESATITPGRALSARAARAGGFVQIPVQTAHALEGLGVGYIIPTWINAARKMWKLTSDPGARRTGGVAPRDFKHQLRTDRHPKTVERHLKILEALGFLERNDVPVPGRQTRFPRRGPGTRVRYYLPGAKYSFPSPRSRPARPSDAQRPPDDPTRRQDAPRGPPEPTPAADPDGPRSGREALERLKAASRT